MQNSGGLFLNGANIEQRRENRGGRRGPPPSRRRDVNHPRDGVRKVRVPSLYRTPFVDHDVLGPTLLSSPISVLLFRRRIDWSPHQFGSLPGVASTSDLHDGFRAKMF